MNDFSNAVQPIKKWLLQSGNEDGMVIVDLDSARYMVTGIEVRETPLNAEYVVDHGKELKSIIQKIEDEKYLSFQDVIKDNSKATYRPTVEFEKEEIEIITEHNRMIAEIELKGEGVNGYEWIGMVHRLMGEGEYGKETPENKLAKEIINMKFWRVYG